MDVYLPRCVEECIWGCVGYPDDNLSCTWRYEDDKNTLILYIYLIHALGEISKKLLAKQLT